MKGQRRKCFHLFSTEEQQSSSLEPSFAPLMGCLQGLCPVLVGLPAVSLCPAGVFCDNVPDVLHSLNVWKTSAGHDEKHFQNVEGALLRITRDDSLPDDVLFWFGPASGSLCANR